MVLRVLSVASEAVPLVKTGGLADVAGALPAAVAPHGVEMTTLLPGYPAVMAAMGKARSIHKWESLLGKPARLLAGKIGEHKLLVLDAPAFFAREGGPYGDARGKDWPDNWHRFAAFGRAAADCASRHGEGPHIRSAPRARLAGGDGARLPAPRQPRAAHACGDDDP